MIELPEVYSCGILTKPNGWEEKITISSAKRDKCMAQIDAQERYSSSRIEGVSFTSSTKEMLAYPLRSRFEDATIRIPDDMEIRADIRAVRKETTASGGIRFCAERTADGHADRFWALALAVYAASSGSSYSRMELVGRKENGFIW